jgi:hypothetical protein
MPDNQESPSKELDEVLNELADLSPYDLLDKVESLQEQLTATQQKLEVAVEALKKVSKIDVDDCIDYHVHNAVNLSKAALSTIRGK